MPRVWQAAQARACHQQPPTTAGCMPARACLQDSSRRAKTTALPPRQVARLPGPVCKGAAQVHLLPAGGAGVLLAHNRPPCNSAERAGRGDRRFGKGGHVAARCTARAANAQHLLAKAPAHQLMAAGSPSNKSMGQPTSDAVLVEEVLAGELHRLLLRPPVRRCRLRAAHRILLGVRGE